MEKKTYTGFYQGITEFPHVGDMGDMALAWVPVKDATRVSCQEEPTMCISELMSILSKYDPSSPVLVSDGRVARPVRFGHVGYLDGNLLICQFEREG